MRMANLSAHEQVRSGRPGPNKSAQNEHVKCYAMGNINFGATGLHRVKHCN